MLLKRKEEKSKLPEGWQLCSRRKIINMRKIAFLDALASLDSKLSFRVICNGWRFEGNGK